MDYNKIQDLLDDLVEGKINSKDVFEKLRILPFEDLDFAKIDHHRTLRKGFPEVVYGPGKTSKQLIEIVSSLYAQSSKILVTRTNMDEFLKVQEVIPQVEYNHIANAIIVDREGDQERLPGVTVISAGTGDLAVAEEAAITAELMGNEVQRIWDVGVAGIHRLLSYLPVLSESKVVVAVAGMDGALPSVLSGLLSVPIIAVPTSVGYGASFEGLAALLTMLNSCSPGVSVVNIDNGFGAGYMAGNINTKMQGYQIS
ncbi:MAG: nickel pincer cofactor biosynthesis protein LarB [Dehalococcoidia bacterium]|nr:nickel pincer cofactor biosynthesis protein LarB [Dehalococcoidia bacterium]